MKTPIIKPAPLRDGHAYCRCKRRQFRATDHIEFCADCAPNKSLSVFREEENRVRNPELPFATKPAPKTPAQPAPPETPESLRRQAVEIRNGAEYCDDANVYKAEIAEATRLESRADELEQRRVEAAEAKGVAA